MAAAFNAPMIDSPGVAIFPASDAMTVIEPPPPAIVEGTAEWQQLSRLMKYPSTSAR
ncbi:MAG: hypothetical protein RLO22_10790 [Sneathiellaceae bacterium]